MRPRVGLGDLLCSWPAWRALRAFRPDLRVTVITWPETAPLLAHMRREVDELLPFPGFPGIPERPPDPLAWPRFLRLARERRFDLAIQTYGDNPAANEVTARLGATARGGFRAEGWWRDEDAPTYLAYPREEHEVWRHLRCVEHLGVRLRPDADRMVFTTLPGDDEEFRRLALEHGLRPGRYVVLHPGASCASRRWPTDRFAQVGDALVERGYAVVIGGVAGERDLADAVRGAMRRPAHDLTGRTSLGGYALVLRHAALLVGNDTGPAHLAAAVGTPTVVVFLSGDPVRWAHPGPRHRVCRVAVGCNPCPHLTCPIDFRCALRLPADAVLSEVDRLLW
ncbi:glycosyltransferase family 9 protein [Streptoalloteichus tenebrarius]|uniref:glycosyltransferase family 9 protein n=1 Tax=Streptoalloteichus tenebrarius (strain ATCC 17920 / DSM 40477 / JCM 4838 / CBS 697.72 / NBRC 16177 / NCIMB 11028 / NRRL B-12390 / A12253. 1 / ISP 5477) TaxID=1933 RepID=UPI0020A5A7E7|nr:glycosyltransferase family 9 protein [Streptoalloteichus tenebrarius]